MAPEPAYPAINKLTVPTNATVRREAMAPSLPGGSPGFLTSRDYDTNSCFQALPDYVPVDTDGWNPPDTHGAVGLNHIVTMLNSQVGFQNRTNTSGSVTSAPATFFVHANSSARLSLFTFSNPQFRFHISGLTNRAYRVDTSTNLSSPTNWYPAYTNTVSYWYTNFLASNDPQRFYRAVTN